MFLQFQERAYEDLEIIRRYIALDNPMTADRFVDLLVGRCAILTTFPFVGRGCDDIRSGYRLMAYRSYLIFYTVKDDTVTVQRILHAARNVRP